MDLLRYQSGPHRIEIACCAQPRAAADQSFEAQAFLVLHDDTPPVTATLSASSAADAIRQVREYLDRMGYEELVALERESGASSLR